MSKAIAPRSQSSAMATIEHVLVRGDLAELTPEQRVSYYQDVCKILGLNPTTKPFDYIVLNGELVLYANKGCAEQLRQVHKISIRITARETHEGVYVVTAQAEGKGGRVDESTGAVTIKAMGGEALANAMMKAETKAKRRVTLSICGLNMLDETEVETIPSARAFTGEPSRPAPAAAPKMPLPQAEPIAAKPTPPPEPEKPKTKQSIWIECRKVGEQMRYNLDILKSWVWDVYSKEVKDLTLGELEEFLATLHTELAGVGNVQ